MFHFNCDDFKDNGWGCCYRSFQNLMKYHAIHFPMEKLVDALGEGHWIEPAELAPLVKEPLRAFCFIWVKDVQGYKNMRRTQPTEYQNLNGKILHVVVALCKRFGAVILDNGTFAYCLWKEGDLWKLADPHCFRRESVVRTMEGLGFLTSSKCWMFLGIK